MRTGNLNNLGPFQDLLADPFFAAAFQWLKAHPAPEPRDDPYPILGDNVTAKVIEYTPRRPSDGKLETHYRHIDLQVVLGPKPERMMFIDSGNLKVTEEHPGTRDVKFYTPPAHGWSEHTAVFELGQFVIFNTESDAHLPQVIVNYNEEPTEHVLSKNRKVVIKILKSALSLKVQL